MCQTRVSLKDRYLKERFNTDSYSYIRPPFINKYSNINWRTNVELKSPGHERRRGFPQSSSVTVVVLLSYSCCWTHALHLCSVLVCVFHNLLMSESKHACPEHPWTSTGGCSPGDDCIETCCRNAGVNVRLQSSRGTGTSRVLLLVPNTSVYFRQTARIVTTFICILKNLKHREGWYKGRWRRECQSGFT